MNTNKQVQVQNNGVHQKQVKVQLKSKVLRKWHDKLSAENLPSEKQGMKLVREYTTSMFSDLSMQIWYCTDMYSH